jgi:phosphotriesterase-related protein
MATVETVRGPVDVEELGTTLMHEHIFLLAPELVQNYGHVWGEPFWDEEVRVADAIAKLNRARDAGITTLVDPTPVGVGRYIPRIQRISESVDMNIIVATGLYAFLELPNFLANRTDDVITGIFVRELREGIDDTGVKAAFLKCTVELHGIIADQPRILTCIAEAQKETGAPVIVHTNAEHKIGLPVLDFLAKAGVDPTRIVIAHAGDSNDLDYLRAIADTGAWLGCDRYGIEVFNSSADRIETLLKLIELGYTDQIHLSHDGAAWYDFMACNPLFEGQEPDYLLIHNELLPALRERGVTQQQIDQMMVENPRRFFS